MPGISDIRLLTTDVQEARKLLGDNAAGLSDEKILAVIQFIEHVWYIIIDEEFTSRGL